MRESVQEGVGAIRGIMLQLLIAPAVVAVAELGVPVLRDGTMRIEDGLPIDARHYVRRLLRLLRVVIDRCAKELRQTYSYLSTCLGWCRPSSCPSIRRGLASCRRCAATM